VSNNPKMIIPFQPPLDLQTFLLLTRFASYRFRSQSAEFMRLNAILTASCRYRETYPEISQRRTDLTISRTEKCGIGNFYKKMKMHAQLSILSIVIAMLMYMEYTIIGGLGAWMIGSSVKPPFGVFIRASRFQPVHLSTWKSCPEEY